MSTRVPKTWPCIPALAPRPASTNSGQALACLPEKITTLGPSDPTARNRLPIVGQHWPVDPDSLGRINSRLDDIEEQISDLEDRVVEITQAEQKKEKKNV